MLSFRDELKEERANLHRSKLVVIREICNEISPAQQWYVMYLGVSSSVETYYWLTDSLSGLEINLNLFPPRIETFPTGHGSHAVCLRTPAEETRGGEKGLASLNRPSVRTRPSSARARPFALSWSWSLLTKLCFVFPRFWLSRPPPQEAAFFAGVTEQRM